MLHPVGERTPNPCLKARLLCGHVAARRQPRPKQPIECAHFEVDPAAHLDFSDLHGGKFIAADFTFRRHGRDHDTNVVTAMLRSDYFWIVPHIAEPSPIRQLPGLRPMHEPRGRVRHRAIAERIRDADVSDGARRQASESDRKAIRLESLQTAIPRWKVALRMLRKHRISMRPELLRRMRDDVAFEFSRQKGAVKVTLKCGKMPSELRIQYRTRAAIVRDRLNRVREALAELEAEGKRAAETLAANPTIIAAQRAAERESAITAFRGARDRLWQVARQCYRRDSLPPWPYRTPAEIRDCARRGISSRQRMNIENAIQGFTRAYEEATAYGWNPLDDESLTEHHHKGAPQRILGLEIAPSSMR